MEQVAECPAAWEDRMLGVSRRAAVRLFDKVLEENVDFLILSGNVLNANLATPGILLFLTEQFDRLKKSGIAVYWAGGEFDSPEDWPATFPIPENVHFFPSNSIQEYFFHRVDGPRADGSPSSPLAKIVGMSRNQRQRRIRSSEFPLDPGGLYTIAVANGDVDPESLSQRRIDYWALGGNAERQVFHGNPRKKGPDGKPIPLDLPEKAEKRDRRDLPPPPYTVHYPGSTIARTPSNIGSYGATLVEIPWGEEPTLTYFTTSPIRWVNDQITLDADADGGKLADELRRRVKNYRENQKGDDLLIRWFVDIPPGPLAASLRRGNMTNDLLSELRSLYSKEEPLTWSVSLSLLLPDRLPKHFYDQQTMLGDFLRSVRHFQEHTEEVIDLALYIPDDWVGDEDRIQELLLAEKVAVDPKDRNENSENGEPTVGTGFRYVQSAGQAENRRRILREAAFVGLELLGGESSKSFSMDHRSVSIIDPEEEEQP